MTKRTFYNGGRVYFLSSVCLQVYNDAGDLIQMMSIEHARKAFPEFFVEDADTEEIGRRLDEIKLNKSRDD
jgi:hypothetical protein